MTHDVGHFAEKKAAEVDSAAFGLERHGYSDISGYRRKR
jgi:hypothetical protein